MGTPFSTYPLLPLYLKPKTIGRIIHNDNILQPPIYDPEILDEHSFFSLDTVFPEQVVGNELAVGVEMGEHGGSVAGVRGGEED